MCLHTGTHLDLPSHFCGDGKDFSGYPLSYFICPGVVLDCSGENVFAYRPQYEALVSEDTAVLLYSGYRCLYEDGYFDSYPVLSRDLADFLIRKKIRILGLDTPSPDKSPFEIHKDLLKNGILLLENLDNLSKLLGAGQFTLYSVPLNLQAEASPVRAFAQVNEWL